MTWLLLAMLACKGDDIDADADGTPASDDCDDTRASVHPGADEICDNLDNDCNGDIDDSAADARTWYADLDGDGHGDPNTPLLSCTTPDRSATTGDDCDDANGLIFPGNPEVCDGADNDCDGEADLGATDPQTFYQDTDHDGFGDSRAPLEACTAPSGTSTDSTDCDDGRAAVYPGAAELCDGLDNNCDESVDEGLSGQGPECPAQSCLALAGSGLGDGVYYIDPDLDFTADAAWCDLSTDGGGWTLLSWSHDSEHLPAGTPYPGLSVCGTLDCTSGSSAAREVLEALLGGSAELAVGHSLTALNGAQSLGDYDSAVIYDYGSLAGFSLAAPGDAAACDASGWARAGQARVLNGPADEDGAAVYVQDAFRFQSEASTHAFDDAHLYAWSPGGANGPCDTSGDAPGTWLGTMFASSGERGPLLGLAGGARSVWAR